jgi:hypothetical protein
MCSPLPRTSGIGIPCLSDLSQPKTLAKAHRSRQGGGKNLVAIPISNQLSIHIHRCLCKHLQALLYAVESLCCAEGPKESVVRIIVGTVIATLGAAAVLSPSMLFVAGLARNFCSGSVSSRFPAEFSLSSEIPLFVSDSGNRKYRIFC